jgi:hypothetical protein
LAVVLALCTVTPVVAQRDIVDINTSRTGGGRPDVPTEFTGTYLFKIARPEWGTGPSSRFPVYGVMTLNGDGCSTSSSLVRSRRWVSEDSPTHGVWEKDGHGRITGRFLTVKLDSAGEPLLIQRSTVELLFGPFAMSGTGTLVVESYSPDQMEIALDPNTTELPQFGTSRGDVVVHRLVGP